MKSRSNTITQKVKTNFGSMYIHIEFNEDGYAVGGSISDPGKEPNSQISQLVDILSNGLNEALSLDPSNGWFTFTNTEKDRTSHFLENGIAICGKVYSYKSKEPSKEDDHICGSCKLFINE